MAPARKKRFIAPAILPGKFGSDREQVRALIRRAGDIAADLGAAPLRTEIEQLAAGAAKPFLFVVVGEVKSGKSSLINALLETDICSVDSLPCTSKIQEIAYGRRKRRVAISDLEEQWFLPHPILEHIAVVDTPGTNSIIREHQVITDGFIPQSDLVLFVFFAKNPYTGSAWELLRHIRGDWHRNTLFVLQQADLLEPAEMERTLTLVKQQLGAEGVDEPTIFTVSVLTGQGMEDLRQYLRTAVVKGRQFNKSISLTHNLRHFLKRLEEALRNHERMLDQDEERLSAARERIARLTADAEREYLALASRAQQAVQNAKEWLQGAGEPSSTVTYADSNPIPPTPVATGAPDRLIDWAKTSALPGRALDVLSGGWENSMRIMERLQSTQIELNRCVFRAHLRWLELSRSTSEELVRDLESMKELPPDFAAMSGDKLIRKRQRALGDARRRVASATDGAQDYPVLGAHAPRRDRKEAMLQQFAPAGAGAGGLVLGFYGGEPIGGILLGAAGFLGVGYAMARRSRSSIGRRSSVSLEKGLEQIDRLLRRKLLVDPGTTQRQLQDSLDRLDRSLLDRRKRIAGLLDAVEKLRGDIERFQSDAWMSSVTGDD